MASLEWWYLEDLARFKREREGLLALSMRVDWLTFTIPHVDDEGRLLVDCDLNIGHRQFPVILRYPHSFPHSPPSVLPRGVDERWSGHQFGAGGELCLEFRPDNWSPDILGWQMIESAYRLLAGENPAPEEHVQVASAHRESEGQRLRGAYSRLLLSREASNVFQAMPVGEHVRGDAIVMVHLSSAVYCVCKLVLADGIEWVDPSFPEILRAEERDIRVHVTRLPSGTPPPSTTTKEDFITEASTFGWDAADVLFFLLIDDGIFAYRIFYNSVRQLWVVWPEPEATRLPCDYATLETKRVGILGCGSMGSKIAAMLARAGVGGFVLADDDVLRRVSR